MAKKEVPASGKARLTAKLYAGVGTAPCTVLPQVPFDPMSKTPKWLGD